MSDVHDDGLGGGRTTPEELTVGAARIIPGALMAVAIAVLVAGAVLVGGGAGSRDHVPDAEALVVSFYETGDAQLVLDHVVPGSVPDDEQSTASLLQQIAQVITQPAEVAETEVVSPLSRDLVIVRMSDGIPWCVDEDQGVLLGCRLGEVTVEATVDAAPLQVDLASMTVFADEAQLLLALIIAEDGGRQYVLEGEPGVTSATGGSTPFELFATVYFAQDGTNTQTDERPLRVRADQALVLDFRARDFDDAQALATDAEVTWDGGRVQVTVASATWFIE